MLFPLVSTQSQLITISIRSQGSTILRLWNPRNNGAALFHKKLETTARSSHLFEIFGRLALHNYGTGPIRLRSSDDWPRRPRVRCLYALQIGAQCQRPSFPLPSRLAVDESTATVFSRSRLLLFLLFTYVNSLFIYPGVSCYVGDKWVILGQPRTS